MDTYVALAEKLGIDLESARKAPGKPSDVFVAYIQAERDTAQAQMAEAVILIAQVQDCQSFEDVKVISRWLAEFLARHAQAEQQVAQGAQAGMELVGYANFDQLDNMLDDRAATLHPKKTGSASTPVYRARAALATQPAVRGAEHE